MVEIRRQYHVHYVELFALQQSPVVIVDVGRWMIGMGGSARFPRAGGDGDQFSAGSGHDGAGVMTAPGTVTNQSKANVAHDMLQQAAAPASIRLMPSIVLWASAGAS